MIERHVKQALVEAIDSSPAVALLGPRQVGKTTLAQEIGDTRPSLYLDLESNADRAKLADPEAYTTSGDTTKARFCFPSIIPGSWIQL